MVAQALAWLLGGEFVVLWQYLGDDKFLEVCSLLADKNLQFPSNDDLERFRSNVRWVNKYLNNEISREEVLKRVALPYFDLIQRVLSNKPHEHLFVKINDRHICKICGKEILNG